MPRQSLNGDGGNGRSCKVRKRGGSSSSSSSLVRTYRLKRAVLVGKRGGSSTPVPMWKMMDASRSPASQNNANSCKYLEGNGGDRGKEFLVSARKLAATLWEINGVSSLRGKENVEKMSEEGENGRKGRGLLKSSKLPSNSLPLQLSHPSHSPVSEVGSDFFFFSFFLGKILAFFLVFLNFYHPIDWLSYQNLLNLVLRDILNS